MNIVDQVKDLYASSTMEMKAEVESGGSINPMKAVLDNAPEFVNCPACKRRALKTAWKQNLYVCPLCGKYRPIGGHYRLKLILDPGTFHEIDSALDVNDPLHFPGYAEKAEEVGKKTGLKESAITGYGRFFMGSMSSVVGEKVTRAIEYAEKKKTPLLIFSSSGGARMQEGIFSLMQMAKTAAAIEEFSEKGGLFISYLTHPTTGGVTASFATLGDITLAEPGALIGFAGPRVIEQTIGEKLPKDFQRAEYLKAHGFIDAIVPRNEMRDTLIKILKLHQKEGRHA